MSYMLMCCWETKAAETEAPSKEGKARDTGSNNATFMSLLYWLNNGAKQATIKTRTHALYAHTSKACSTNPRVVPDS